MRTPVNGGTLDCSIRRSDCRPALSVRPRLARPGAISRAAADLLRPGAGTRARFCARPGSRSARSVRSSATDAGAVAAFQCVGRSIPQDRSGARPASAGSAPPMRRRHAARLCASAVRSICAALRWGPPSLAYRAPDHLRDAVESRLRKPMTFHHMLDLGCGTGLAGAAFRPLVRQPHRRRSFARHGWRKRAPRDLTIGWTTGDLLQFLAAEAAP